ncbi:MAG: hypothetical protein M3O92_04370 [Actinomycetota bacterium]|nr:hypothetical protein [Actinomycetota bacterium]
MRSLAVAVCAVLLLLLPTSAFASEIIDRNAHNVRLGVDAKGQALVTYQVRGHVMHVRVWGAVNARHPTMSRPQVSFRKDYSGRNSTSFKNQCRAYDGAKLAFQVAACAAPDGSYWALQSWRRTLPNFDGRPRSWLGARELHVSHWSSAIATLDAWTDWVYGGRYHHLFGRLTYDGRPVYGFSATRVGSPLDSYGRNVYVDTLDSRYGKGWRRENAFLSHRPTGVFCYGFYRFTSRGPGNGAKYRLTAIGPGVTPDVSITIPGLHDYDANSAGDVEYEQQQNALQDSIAGVDKKCRVH